MTMHYKFPVITHISQVEKAIENNPNFIIVDKGDYKVVNYVRSGNDTFPPVTDENTAILRECRGIIFDKEGYIIRRPLHKFKNINEDFEYTLENLNFNLSHRVYSKLDGSMISPFKLDNKIRFGTKMGITDVSMIVEKYVEENPKYLGFSSYCIENGITPIFEYTGPDNRIVVNYEKSMLTLLAARYMITGEYLIF